MAKMLFYKKPVPLNKNNHKALKLVEGKNRFQFAKDVNSVLLSGVEFTEGAKEYPIVFAPMGKDNIMPIGLLGFRDKENHFVNDANEWTGRYIPAFIRRYPFVLAEADDKGRLDVYIDEESDSLRQDVGQPLFTDSGENSPLLDNVLKFLNEFQQQFQRTELFVKTLREMELLVPLKGAVKLGDRQIALDQLLVVDEKKLLELDDAKALQLMRTGMLSWIYSHLMSLSNLNSLAKLGSTPKTDNG